MEEFNRFTDEVAHLHWLEGTELGPDGLEFVDTPWALGVSQDEKGVAIE